MNVTNQLAVLDQAIALSRVGGDEELLREMAQLFLEEYPRVLSEVRSAVGSGNAKAVERGAHNLKGSVGNFGADSAFQAALELEMAGRRGNLADIKGQFARLEAALRDLHPLMQQLGDCR